MGSILHKPEQTLAFRFVENESKLYVVSNATVELEQGETIRLRESSPVVMPGGEFGTVIHFDILTNSTSNNTFTAQLSTHVLVRQNMNYTGSPTTYEQKIADIRAQIEYILNTYSPNKAYTIQADVVETTGQVGGQTTSTIDSVGQIIII